MLINIVFSDIAVTQVKIRLNF